MNEKDKNKKAASAAVAVAASVGMLLSGLFSSPADLARREETAPPPPAPVVEYVMPDIDPDDDDDDGGLTGIDDEDEEKQGSFRARFRRRILRVPQPVRAVIGVPLWCVGWALTGLLSLLWAGLVSPVMGVVLRWAVAALLILLAVVLTLKAVFPDLPLKKLLSKRNILTVFIGMTVLGIADAVVSRAVPGKEFLPLLIRLGGSLAVMAAAVIPSVIEEIARRREDETEPPEMQAKEQDYRAKVLELADSVK